MLPCVFIDLDSTLTRTYRLEHIPADMLESSRPVFADLVSVARPGVRDFLSRLGDRADLYLFTAARLGYAKSVLVGHKLHRHFKGMYSGTRETAHTVAEALDLGDRKWVLVDDNHSHDPVLKHKLNCLGITDGREKQPLVVNRHYIQVKSYHPHEGGDDNDLDRVYPLILDRIRDHIRFA